MNSEALAVPQARWIAWRAALILARAAGAAPSVHNEAGNSTIIVVPGSRRSAITRWMSLSFNGLATRDVERAKSFYGSVFGWTTLALGGGAELWTLPG